MLGPAETAGVSKHGSLVSTQRAPTDNLLLAALSSEDRLRLLADTTAIDLSLSETLTRPVIAFATSTFPSTASSR
jgi:hypothetical protein